MIELVTVTVEVSAAAALALVVLRWALGLSAARRRSSFRLRFPRDVEPSHTVAALRSLHGLLPPAWRRWLHAPSVVIEVVGSADGIEHFLRVPSSRADFVLGQLRAAVPGLRIKEADAPQPRFGLARQLRAVGPGSLRTDRPAETNAAVLAALQPVASGDAIAVQWVLTPVADPFSVFRRLLGSAGDAPSTPAEPDFAAVCRIGVCAKEPGRLLARVLGALQTASTAERLLRRGLRPSASVAAGLRSAASPLLAPTAMGADELAAVLGVPLGGPQLAGLTLSGSRQLPPHPAIPAEGRVLGDSPVTGAPLAIGSEESRQGLVITAPTGAGKSTVLEHLCAADFAVPHRAVIVIESKDLCRSLADLVPAERLDETLIFDPADAKPVGWNVIAGGEEAADLITDHVVGQFRRLYAGYLGPRSEMLLRAALLSLSGAPGQWTLCEVMPLLTDAGFRRRVLAELDDHALASVWSWFEAQSPAAQAEMVSPLANKLAAFTLRRRLRAVIGQADSALNFDTALAEGRIVLCSLAKGLLGEDAASLLGSCLVAELWAAIQRRAVLPPSQRPYASVVLDEAQDFLRLPVALGDAVAKSRGLGVGWTAAFQNTGQVGSQLRGELLANLRSKLVMQTTADDARVFARELAPHVSPADLQGLGPFEGYAAISLGSAVAPPASIVTRPPRAALGHGERLRAQSRARYGRDPQAVETELRARLEAPPADAPLGARRRR